MALGLSRRPVPEDTGPASFRSPGLELVVDRLEARDKPRVLDLGAPRRANLDFLSRTPCVVCLEDLPHALEDTPQPEPVDEHDHVDWDSYVASLLAFDPATRFDVILAWDLLCYMRPEVIRSLVARIARSSVPATLLFMTVSTGATLPERPAHVSINAEGRLVYRPESKAERPNPGYSPLALERMMPGFGLLHSFLLGEGMQDYLFSYRGV